MLAPSAGVSTHFPRIQTMLSWPNLSRVNNLGSMNSPTMTIGPKLRNLLTCLPFRWHCMGLVIGYSGLQCEKPGLSWWCRSVWLIIIIGHCSIDGVGMLVFIFSILLIIYASSAFSPQCNMRYSLVASIILAMLTLLTLGSLSGSCTPLLISPVLHDYQLSSLTNSLCPKSRYNANCAGAASFCYSSAITDICCLFMSNLLEFFSP